MGLFPCTFNRASSVFLTVALVLCTANVRATKIEFSVPTSEIEIPDQQKEIKQDAKAALKSEMSFKGSLNVGPMAAPIVIAPQTHRDSFSKETDKDSEKSRYTRRTESNSEKPDTAALAEKYKAAQAAEAMREKAEDSLASSAWQPNRNSAFSRNASRETDSSYNPRERNVGWSTLFKEAQEERERKEQTARLKDFKALYEPRNSMSPIGTPAANTDPVKDALWRDQGLNQRDNSDQLFSRRDDPNYQQALPGSRGSVMDSFNNGPTRHDFRNNEIAPIRDFEQHRGVLEFPKRPGDVLNR